MLSCCQTFQTSHFGLL